MPESGRTYGCLETEFPDEDERPSDGYAELGIRGSVTFNDRIEIFDVLSEFDHAEGILRYRAQEMGNAPNELASIKEAVDEYVRAANELMLWDPKARFDPRQELNDLFKARDWTPFISPGAFAVPNVDISNVEVLSKDIDDDWLVKFFYINGDVSGWELEYAELREGRMMIRRDSYSALRSASPAFSGQQLPQVYDALQRALEQVFFVGLNDALLHERPVESRCEEKRANVRAAFSLD
ncbi:MULTISPECIES: hypothetical protein [Rhizobium]|uniref:hypothetical protein n=1 Tax=Rhizobium TaxID=379 RepID=UPI00234F3A76|nr:MULTISPECIES: hypothetical protein [unclassified Rhizobium]MDC7742574.1 hypothetical protein [Rhizobium sp. BC56]WEA27325.1 hypothetical protein PO862_08420 [Rhizobium sp. MJ22]WEA61798.1 hypothetical protein PO860_08080 [Rhizobium sp. BJ04]